MGQVKTTKTKQNLFKRATVGTEFAGKKQAEAEARKKYIEAMTEDIETLFELHAKHRKGATLSERNRTQFAGIVERHNAFVASNLEKSLSLFRNEDEDGGEGATIGRPSIEDMRLFRHASEYDDFLTVAIKLLMPEMKRAGVGVIRRYGFDTREFMGEALSEMMEGVHAIFSKDKKNASYPVYKTIQVMYSRRVIDAIRQVRGATDSKQAQFRRESIQNISDMQQFEEINSERFTDTGEANPAKVVEIHSVIDSLFASDTMTADEKTIMRVLYENGGDVSNREIGRLTGIDHKRVARLLVKIREKASAIIA